jgi:hypothetical protein
MSGQAGYVHPHNLHSPGLATRKFYGSTGAVITEFAKKHRQEDVILEIAAIKCSSPAPLFAQKNRGLVIVRNFLEGFTELFPASRARVF